MSNGHLPILSKCSRAIRPFPTEPITNQGTNEWYYQYSKFPSNGDDDDDDDDDDDEIVCLYLIENQ